ncbi:hypothetical protein J155_02708 [Xanthomonas citri pv. citri]|nr:hypothetical protein J151_02717 [Xanthomonas citri subsp. citri A306]AJY82658.1 hypothetical protein J159_02702 [Xanthomonas citri pv. citri]AJY87082.1 hypothetical protein J158_02704 [Xanthomonas citri subsp. citri UI6]QYF45426.1 hypothetical protein HZS93_02746 [Xanthomonas citri]AJY91516.1 hypothetical protein J169_02714 [Xanthomonas citri pv. citri]
MRASVATRWTTWKPMCKPVGRYSIARSLGIGALRVGMPGAVPETSASSERIGVRIRQRPCHLTHDFQARPDACSLAHTRRTSTAARMRLRRRGWKHSTRSVMQVPVLHEPERVDTAGAPSAVSPCARAVLRSACCGRRCCCSRPASRRRKWTCRGWMQRWPRHARRYSFLAACICRSCPRAVTSVQHGCNR